MTLCFQWNRCNALILTQAKQIQDVLSPAQTDSAMELLTTVITSNQQANNTLLHLNDLKFTLKPPQWWNTFFSKVRDCIPPNRCFQILCNCCAAKTYWNLFGLSWLFPFSLLPPPPPPPPPPGWGMTRRVGGGSFHTMNFSFLFQQIRFVPEV